MLCVPLYFVYATHPTGEDDFFVILDQPQANSYVLKSITTQILTADQTSLIIQASSDLLGIEIQGYSPSYATVVGDDTFFFDKKKIVLSAGRDIIISKYASYDELKAYLSTTQIRDDLQYSSIWDQSITVVLDATSHGYDDNAGLSYRWSIQNTDIQHTVIPPILTGPTHTIPLNAKTTDTFVIGLIVRDSSGDIFSDDIDIQVYNGTIYGDDYSLKEQPVPFDINDPIRVALDPSWEPFEVYKDNNDVGGLTGKYIERFESLTGAEFVTVVPGDFDAALNAVKNRDADVMFWVSDIPERSNFMRFTSPILFLDEDVFVTIGHKDITSENLAEHRVAIINAYSHHTILDEYFSDVSYTEYSNHLEAIKALANNEADVFISDIVVSSYYASTLGIKVVQSNSFEYVGSDNDDGLRIGYRSDSPELGTFLENTLNDIPDCTRAKLLNDILDPQSTNTYTQTNNTCHPDSQQNDQINNAIAADAVTSESTKTRSSGVTSESTKTRSSGGGGSGNTLDSRVCGGVLCSETLNQPADKSFDTAVYSSPSVLAEPTADPKPIPDSVPTCGPGTETVDGICKVIAVPTCGPGTETVDGICKVIAVPTCGPGTETVDGICKVIAEPTADPKSEDSWFSILGKMLHSFFANLV